jgi:phosphatidylglycerophosphate synthase
MPLSQRFSMEQFFIAITVSRLALTAGLITAMTGQLPYPAAWLASVVAADVPNGILARRFGADTPRRRIADSVVDRITIGAACTTMALERPEVAVALIPLAVRGAITVVFSLGCFYRKRAIVTSQQIHKLGSLATGGMGFVLLSRSGYWPWAVTIASAISFILLAAYVPVWLRVLRSPPQADLTRFYTVY